MASLHNSLVRSMRLLRELSLSQRMAILLGGALIAGSLAWMAQWAATPELAPLFSESLSGQDLTRVQAGLDAMGQTHRVDGGRVLVPSAASRPSIIARLQQQNQAPHDTSVTFASLVQETNPWISQAENARRWTIALQKELEGALASLSGVREAHVFLNLNAKPRGFSREQPESSASVTLITGGEPVTRELAQSAARLVSGAVRGLSPRMVQVVDASGGTALEWDDSLDAAPGLYRLKRQTEREVAGKIQRQLDFDPALRVNVQVVLDHERTSQQEIVPTEPVEIERSVSSTGTTRARAAAQPGVQPNTGLAVGGGSGDESSVSETSDVKNQPAVSTRTSAKTPGEIRQVFAAINVSRSYLASVYRRNNPQTEEEPTEQQVQQVFDAQKARIVSQVEKLVLPPSAEQVAVDWYYDSIAAVDAPSGSTMDISLDLARNVAPAAGLGLLALLSIGLMLRMAKKGHDGDAFALEIGLPTEVIDAARRAREAVVKATAVRKARAEAGVPEETTGAPIPGSRKLEGVLEGQELNEADAGVATMVEQMSDLIERDPQSMAAMVERWMGP